MAKAKAKEESVEEFDIELEGLARYYAEQVRDLTESLQRTLALLHEVDARLHPDDAAYQADLHERVAKELGDNFGNSPKTSESD